MVLLNRRWCQRRWAKRGRAAADYLCCFLITVIEHFLHVGWVIVRRGFHKTHAFLSERHQPGRASLAAAAPKGRDGRACFRAPHASRAHASPHLEAQIMPGQSEEVSARRTREAQAPVEEEASWADVWDSDIRIDGRPVQELSCCERELVSLIHTGQARKTCRVCGNPVTARIL